MQAGPHWPDLASLGLAGAFGGETRTDGTSRGDDCHTASVCGGGRTRRCLRRCANLSANQTVTISSAPHCRYCRLASAPGRHPGEPDAHVPGLRNARPRDQAGSVLLSPTDQRFMIAGGGDADQNLPPTDKVGIIGLKASAATSQPAADLPGPGWLYLTMTTLPDRTVLASNGPTGQAFPITTTGAVVSASLTSPARPRTRRTPTHGCLICPSTGAQPPTRGCGAGDRRVADLKPERGNRT